jgi:hypothetical protein
MHTYLENIFKPIIPIPLNKTLSFSYVYNLLAGCPNLRCGLAIPLFLNYLKNNGNVTMQDFSKVDATPRTLKAVESSHKILDFFPLDGSNLNSIKEKILGDMPVLVCVATTDEFKQFKNKTESDTFGYNGSYANCVYHAILITGYDDAKHAFRIMNSYGADWGVNGFGWIGYATFRDMMTHSDNTGYFIVIRRAPIPAGAPFNEDTISRDNFHPYVYLETIKKDKYSITSGFKIDPDYLFNVSKITYVYKNPAIVSSYSSYKKPNFENTIIGPSCLKEVAAIITFVNGNQLNVNFNQCELVASPKSYPAIEQQRANISVYGSAEFLSPGKYNFRIQLLGIDGLKDDIKEVVYDRNDPTFNDRFQAITDKESNFQSNYIGWGCLDHVVIVIHFKDNTFKLIDFNMCKYLGWD